MTVIKFCIIVLVINICFLFTPMLIGYLWLVIIHLVKKMTVLIITIRKMYIATVKELQVAWKKESRIKMLEFVKSKKLLNIDNNAKTVKGQKYGFMTAILYLAPSTQSGFNVCPQASNGCKKACLFTAGHGAFNNVIA